MEMIVFGCLVLAAAREYRSMGLSPIWALGLGAVSIAVVYSAIGEVIRAVPIAVPLGLLLAGLIGFFLGQNLARFHQPFG